jgi:hypothetical protein
MRSTSVRKGSPTGAPGFNAGLGSTGDRSIIGVRRTACQYSAGVPRASSASSQSRVPGRVSTAAAKPYQIATDQNSRTCTPAWRTTLNRHVR